VTGGYGYGAAVRTLPLDNGEVVVVSGRSVTLLELS
jgi:hypothetical protein